MSEEKSSKTKQKKHKRKKHFTVYPYFNYAILYVLISMVVVIPILVFGLNSAVNTVHNAQKVLVRDLYDWSLDNTYDEKNESNYLEDIYNGKLIGTISCSRAGIYEKVYYGTNRVTMRDGAGLSTNSYLPGNGGCTSIAGYASSSLKGLYDVHKGDVIVLETYWGTFKYSITDIYEAEALEKTEGDKIALATFTSTDAFACQNGKMLYVVGDLISKEVN